MKWSALVAPFVCILTPISKSTRVRRRPVRVSLVETAVNIFILRSESFDMRTIISTILCVLALGVMAEAANYTVKAGGGGNYSTIQSCANAMVAGDTCTVYAGTYNENVTLSSGSAGNYKTLQVNGTDTVYVYSFSIGSHTKVIGFHIQNTSSPTNAACVAIANQATDFYVTSNTMYACAGGVNELDNATGTSDGYIQNNTISYMCSTSSSPNVCGGITVIGGQCLIEGNDISHVSYGIRAWGPYIVIRGNHFHDNRGTGLTPTDCGSNSANCHIDFVESDAQPDASLTPAAHYQLIENNTISNNLGSNSKTALFQAEGCTSGACHNAIVRFNAGVNVGGSSTDDDNDGVTATPGWSHVKLYNNDWLNYSSYQNPPISGSLTDGITNNSTNAAELNNIFYYVGSLLNYNPYFADASSTPFSYGHNLAWCTNGVANCQVWGHTYGGGLFTADAGNIESDPLFVNYAGGDFRLSTNSPAAGAGTYLTQVAASDSGTGTSLVVNDVDYFQDGLGLNSAGVQADCIAVGTVSNTVCIAPGGLNYSTNTIMLAKSINRSSGQSIWLYSDSTGAVRLFGSAPNIGATVALPAGAASLTATGH